MSVRVHVEPARVIGRRDPKIYGHFVEHFHRQVYGGIFDPGSELSDETGLRVDVIDAIRRINPSVIRWPGGCFASAYHWKDGVGRERVPKFDKAWRVEESNRFGTDEFITFCRKVGAEPYICTNAGSGTPEEMSDWVQYCNLRAGSPFARQRIDNGHPEPFHVRYWSIGNENYLSGEIGARTIAEWGPYVRESAKMMKRVDPTIEVLAACIGVESAYRSMASPFDWNVQLLKEAGQYIDWVSIHGYWDRLNRVSDRISPYESCMFFSARIEERILYMRHLLGAMGLLGRLRIAFDEWNLRCWHHPNMDAADEGAYLLPRDVNDINSQYTTADAIFAACFLNQCLKHCDVVGMANFSPLVNTRGTIYSHTKGIVTRSTYHVFRLYTEIMGDNVVDWWVENPPTLEVTHQGNTVRIPAIDIAATRHSEKDSTALALVNRDPDHAIEAVIGLGSASVHAMDFHCLVAPDKDAWNDVGSPSTVRVEAREASIGTDGKVWVLLEPHSVGILSLSE
jgi:alpha-N-arabinofuranosidase